jgi:hypothetical protein
MLCRFDRHRIAGDQAQCGDSLSSLLGARIVRTGLKDCPCLIRGFLAGQQPAAE